LQQGILTGEAVLSGTHEINMVGGTTREVEDAGLGIQEQKVRTSGVAVNGETTDQRFSSEEYRSQRMSFE
jgi:hypothetical protein